MLSESSQAVLLLAILRERWDEASALARAGVDPDRFVELCRTCDVHPWVHTVLEEHDRFDLVGEAVRERLGQARAKVRNDNLLLLARAEQALDLLLAAGIVPVALKGLDTLHRFYRFDQRTLDDVDLLIRREDLQPALEALESAGWVPPDEPRRSHYIRSSHHLALTSPGAVPVEFELHWNLAQEVRYRIDARGLLDRAVKLEVEGRTILRLEDHDLVAHLLVHHFSHYFDRRLKWLVDLRALSAQPQFRWDRVAERIREWGGVAAAGASLLHLHKLWPELVPETVLLSLPVAAWRRALAWPLRTRHPLDLYRGTRNRRVQLYLAAVMMEKPGALPAWMRHRAVRDERPSTNPLDAESPANGDDRS